MSITKIEPNLDLDKLQISFACSANKLVKSEKIDNQEGIIEFTGENKVVFPISSGNLIIEGKVIDKPLMLVDSSGASINGCALTFPQLKITNDSANDIINLSNLIVVRCYFENQSFSYYSHLLDGQFKRISGEFNVSDGNLAKLDLFIGSNLLSSLTTNPKADCSFLHSASRGQFLSISSSVMTLKLSLLKLAKNSVLYLG